MREIDFNNGVVRYENNDLEYKLDGLFLTKGSTTFVQRYHSFGDHLNLLELNNDSVDTTKSQFLGYDDAQRLTSASASGTYGKRSWTYDLVGNRLSEVKTPSGSSTSTTSAFNYPKTSNLLTSVTQGSTTTRAFTYDAAGNTTQDKRASTAYNYAISDAGRISQLTIGTTVTAKYTYDAKDRLSVRQTLNMSPAGTTQMLYDVWDHLLAETDGAGHVVKQYIWVGDEPVAVLDGTSNAASPTLYYVHADHLQRPELMTNAVGSVVWTAYYEPFGAVSSITGSLTENQRFPGQWFQLEAGLHYNWHRHYDPTLGRYTSPDPLGPFLSPGASVPSTIVGTSVENGSGPTVTGVTAPPAMAAVDPESYPALPVSLLGRRQLGFGTTTQIPLNIATMVLRDGSSLFDYANENPLLRTDSEGLFPTGRYPGNLGSSIQLCAKKRPPANGPRCDGVCTLGTPGIFLDPNTGDKLCFDCFTKRLGRRPTGDDATP